MLSTCAGGASPPRGRLSIPCAIAAHESIVSSKAAESESSGFLTPTAIELLPYGLLCVGSNLDLDHLVRVGDATAGRAGRRLLELVDDVHPLHHVADDSVLIIQK